MSRLTRNDRQRIIDGYLAATGANLFVASEFIDWLAGEPDHEVYPWFFGKDDTTLAREHRIGMARQMASGLRITVKTENVDSRKVVHITAREYPAFVSPMGGRRDGGGYVAFNLDDPETAAELSRQGATALRSWLARYRGVAEQQGIAVSAIEKIASRMDVGGVAKSA